jgi:hypothetical protein
MAHDELGIKGFNVAPSSIIALALIGRAIAETGAPSASIRARKFMLLTQ